MNQLVVIFLFLIFGFGIAADPTNSTNVLCSNTTCLTCNNNICITTCKGAEMECKKCELGTCCDGVRCNACRGKVCCEDAACNNCIKTCIESCEIDQLCHQTCFQQCLPNKYQTNNSIFEIPHFYSPHNVRTDINITNSMNNFNNAEMPVVVDNVVKSKTTSNCCNLVHPEVCQKFNNQTLCFTAKSKECSKRICKNSQNVHIVEIESTNQPCFKTGGEPPYPYCGKYVLKNCDKCYNCPDVNNERCADQSDCPQECKAGIREDDTYNKLYNFS